MYLTRFEINPARRGAKKLLGSPQAMHAAILAGYPSEPRSPYGRVLWRVDRSAERTMLYVAGPHEPDLTHLVEQAGWPTLARWQTRPYAALLDHLRKGDRWAFRLTANPTRSTRLGNAARSQRFGQVTAQQQIEWLTGRIGGWGARVPETKSGPALIVRDRRTWEFNRRGGRVTITTATFDGELIVEDPELLKGALCRGVGPAKAYGCGLITLARPRTSS